MSDQDVIPQRTPVETGSFETSKNIRWLEEPEAFAAERTVLIPAAELGLQGEACLMVVHGNELARRYHLRDDSMQIGRSSTADIQLAAGGVSRVHARIERKLGTYRIIDLDSTNGTFVNGLKIDQHTLQNGDRVTLGDTTLRFLLSERIDAACYDEIYRLTTTDDATGIYNRRYFFQTLEREVARAIRHKRALSLLMLEVDEFQSLNRHYGFLAGDTLLVQLAGRIQSSVRMEDIFARLGGEEFCLLLPETDAAGALAVAVRVQQLIANHAFTYDGETISLTASVGISTLDDTRPSSQSVHNWQTTSRRWLDALMERADERLLHAKASGSNRVAQ